MSITKEERAEALRKFYCGEKRLQIDPNTKMARRQDGILFHVGQLVRYTDEVIDLSNKIGARNTVFDKLYKKTWQKKFMTIVGFDMDDPNVTLVTFKDELGQVDTLVCHLSAVQPVSESEKILYEK